MLACPELMPAPNSFVFEAELNRLAAIRSEILERFSTDSLWEAYKAWSTGKTWPAEPPPPEVWQRILEQLAAPSLVAELRRRHEVAELEDESP